MVEEHPILVVPVGVADQAVQDGVGCQLPEDRLGIQTMAFRPPVHRQCYVPDAMVPTTGVAASVVTRYALGHDLVPVHPEPFRFGEGRGLSAQHVAEPGQLNLGAAHADETPYLGRDLLSPMLTEVVPRKLEQAPDAVLPSEPELALAPQALRLVLGIDAGVRHLEDRVVGINHGSYFAGSPARLLPILRVSVKRIRYPCRFQGPPRPPHGPQQPPFGIAPCCQFNQRHQRQQDASKAMLLVTESWSLSKSSTGPLSSA